MKKLLLLLMMIASVNVFAQDEELDDFEFADETPFSTQELQEEKTEYFLLTGGYTGTLLWLNFDEFNKQMQNVGFGTKDFESPLYLNGVQGITGIFYFLPNMRIGFVSMAGSKMDEIETTAQVNSEDISVNRGVEFAVDYTGFSLDYAIVPVNSLAITFGATFGWGNMTLESWQMPNEMSWTEFGKESNQAYYINRAHQSYWFVQPNLNLEYALELIEGAKLIMFRVNVGYPYTFSLASDSEKWKFNRGASIMDMPDEINANGLSVQFGIFIGLFNF